MRFLGQLHENPLKEIPIYKGLPPQEEGNTEKKIVIMMILEGHVEIRDPLIEEGIQIKVGEPLTKEDTLIEDLLEEDILIGMGDPLEEEDTLAVGLLMEMGDLLVDKDHQALKDHLDQ